ncbi:MAG: hypothetical protein HY553_10730, partial [Elusimicrobia bacterium]|nr:hypothetical protein [Elusimicrobiota bacterium]
FEAGGEGGLVTLPCGGGKSTLALELRRRTGFGLLGDDTVWIDPALRLRAFPLRWGFRPEADLSDVPPALVRPFHRKLHGAKRLVDVRFFQDRVIDAVPLTRLYVGERGGGPASVEPLRPARAFAALVAPLILGVGLAQMTESTLRLAAAGSLAKTAARRARRAWEAASRAECFRLRMGERPEDARAALVSAFRHVTRKEELHLGPAVAEVRQPELAAGRPGDAIG